MPEEIFQFPPILYTERLILTLDDFTKDADEQQFTDPEEILDLSPEDAIKRAQGSIDLYCSYGRLQLKFLRGCKRHSGLVGPGYRGQGYATESAKKVLRYFRDELGVHPGSPKSSDVAKRVGYVPVENGLRHVDGVTKLLLYVLPTAAPLPEDLVFSQYARVE
ncbi:hypothetical protein ACQKWADRAFT_323530 [Trichoderma austrokoningii]